MRLELGDCWTLNSAGAFMLHIQCTKMAHNPLLHC